MLQVAVIASLTMLAASSQESTIDKDRLLTNFKAATQAYLNDISHVHIEGKYKDRLRRNPKFRPTNWRLRYMRSDSCEYLEESYDEERTGFFNRAIVDCGANDFVVRRRDRRADFFLEYTSLGDVFGELIVRKRSEVANSPYSVSMFMDFPAYILSEHFTFTEAKGHADPQLPGCVDVVFYYDPHEASKPWKLHGGLTIDPNRRLSIVSYDVELVTNAAPDKPVISSGSVRYRDDSDKVVPSEIQLNYSKGKDGSYINSSTFEVSRWEYGPISPAEFSLNKFGLGDLQAPITKTPARRLWAYWGFGASLLLLAAFAVYRRRKK